MAAAKLGHRPEGASAQRNLVRAEEFPYKVASGIVWDRSGFIECLERRLRGDRLRRTARKQAEARAAGRWFGIGIACYAELTGIGSRISVAPGMPINTGTETATIRIDFDRRGHGRVRRRFARPGAGDDAGAGRRRASRRALRGHPHRAGRQRGGAGRHRHLCEPQHACWPAAPRRSPPQAVREKVLNAASHLLEAAPADLVAEDGRVCGRRHRPLGDVPRGRARGLFRDGPAAGRGARGARRHQDLRSGVRHHHLGDAHRHARDRPADLRGALRPFRGRRGLRPHDQSA